MPRAKLTMQAVEFNDAGFKSLVEQVNGLIAELDTLYAKLNADGDLTATDFGTGASTKVIE